MNAKQFLIVLGLLLSLADQGSMAQGPVSARKPGLKETKAVLPEERQLIESLDGRLLFRAYCASCHGEDAKGNGPVAASLKKTPSDLTRISQRNGGTFPLIRVQQTISGENSPTAAHGSREMPIWGPVFGQIAWDQDLGQVRIYNLAKYIESLQERPQ